MHINQSNKMNVAILVRGFPNIVQTYIVNHITSLIDFGYDIGIIAVSNPKQREVHPAIGKYKLIERAIYINTDKSNFITQLRGLPIFNQDYIAAVSHIVFSRLWAQYGFIYTIKAIIKARLTVCNNFNFAHSHALISSYEYLFLKDIFGIPLVTTFHGLEPKSAQPLSANKLKKVLDNCDAFFLNTDFAKKQLTGLGCDENKIYIIPQGTNLNDFPFTERKIKNNETITILSVGRLSVEKGFHVAIDAIARLVDKYPNIRYHIIGSGVEDTNLQRQIKTLKLQNNVKIIGGVSTEILQSQYAAAHMFVLPSIDFCDGSHTETQGVVLQEAQSSGIPVIASRTGGIPEIIIDGTTGLLFDEQDDAGLAEKIESLLNDQVQYKALSIAARKDVEDNYSVETICQRQLKVYSKIMNQKM